jgi:hypothetical protein
MTFSAFAAAVMMGEIIIAGCFERVFDMLRANIECSAAIIKLRCWVVECDCWKSSSEYTRLALLSRRPNILTGDAGQRHTTATTRK